MRRVLVDEHQRVRALEGDVGTMELREGRNEDLLLGSIRGGLYGDCGSSGTVGAAVVVFP